MDHVIDGALMTQEKLCKDEFESTDKFLDCLAQMIEFENILGYFITNQLCLKVNFLQNHIKLQLSELNEKIENLENELNITGSHLKEKEKLEIYGDVVETMNKIA